MSQQSYSIETLSSLERISYPNKRSKVSNGEANKLYPEDRPAHEWYRFVLSYPPHLVRDYLERFGITGERLVLDPFCGTGTTLVECKKLGIPSVGIEATPMAYFASQVKVDWSPDPDGLAAHASMIADLAWSALGGRELTEQPVLCLEERCPYSILKTLPSESMGLLLKNSISPLPLHKTLTLLDCIEKHKDERYYRHELLALAKSVVSEISNLQFGPEVGSGPAKVDSPVISLWLNRVNSIADDLRVLSPKSGTRSLVHKADSRCTTGVLEPCSVDAVITSPPYPNEKDYTRTTRLESVLLGFIKDKVELRALKQTLIRSNTRGVYKGDDDDDWVRAHTEIQRIADAIEERRLELGKTSGFERMYARVTRLYFGGMARHLAELRSVLKPGARLAYVVGDQASYLRIMIRTGQLLGDIAKSLGYELESIDLFRTRLSTATKEQLREEAVVLRWPGSSSR